jgi:hypothetical protein
MFVKIKRNGHTTATTSHRPNVLAPGGIIPQTQTTVVRSFVWLGWFHLWGSFDFLLGHHIVDNQEADDNIGADCFI